MAEIITTLNNKTFINTKGPLDSRCIVENYEDIQNIAYAYVGMLVVVNSTGKCYQVVSVTNQKKPNGVKPLDADVDIDKLGEEIYSKFGDNWVNGWKSNLDSYLNNIKSDGLNTLKDEIETSKQNYLALIAEQKAEHQQALKEAKEAYVNDITLAASKLEEANAWFEDVQENATNKIDEAQTDWENKVVKAHEEIESIINTAKNRLNQAQAQLADALTTAYTAYDNALASYQENFSANQEELNDKLEQAKSTINSAKAWFNDQQEEAVEKINNAQTAWENQITEAQASIVAKLEYAQGELDDAQERLSQALTSAYNEYNEVLASYNNDIEAKRELLETKVGEAHEALADARTTINDTQDKINSAMEELKQLSESVGEAFVDIDTVNAMIEASTRFADISAMTINEASQIINGKEASIISSAQSISEHGIISVMQQMEAVSGTLKQAIEAVDVDSESVTTMVNEWNSAKGSIQQAIERVDTLRDEVTKTVEEMNTEGFTRMSERISELSGSVTSVTQTVSNLQGSIAEAGNVLTPEFASEWAEIKNASAGYIATSGSYITEEGIESKYEDFVDYANGIKATTMSSLEASSGILNSYIDRVDVKAASALTQLSYFDASGGIQTAFETIVNAQDGIRTDLATYATTGELNSYKQEIDAANASVRQELEHIVSGEEGVTFITIQEELNALDGKVSRTLGAITSEDGEINFNEIFTTLNAVAASAETAIKTVNAGLDTAVSDQMTKFGALTEASLANIETSAFTKVQTSINSLEGSIKDEINNSNAEVTQTLKDEISAIIGGSNTEYETIIKDKGVVGAYTELISTVSGKIQQELSYVATSAKTAFNYKNEIDAIKGSAETAMRYATEEVDGQILSAVDLAKGIKEEAFQYINKVSGDITNYVTTITPEGTSELKERISSAESSITRVSTDVNLIRGEVDEKIGFINKDFASDWVEVKNAFDGYRVVSGSYATSAGVETKYSEVLSTAEGYKNEMMQYLDASASTLNTYINNVDVKAASGITALDYINKEDGINAQIQNLTDAQRGYEEKLAKYATTGALNTVRSEINAASGYLKNELESIVSGDSEFSLSSIRQVADSAKGYVEQTLESLQLKDNTDTISVKSLVDRLNVAEGNATRALNIVSSGLTEEVKTNVAQEMSRQGVLTSASIKDVKLSAFTEVQNDINVLSGSITNKIEVSNAEVTQTLTNEISKIIGGSNTEYETIIRDKGVIGAYTELISTVSGKIQEELSYVATSAETAFNYKNEIDAVAASAMTAYRYATTSGDGQVQKIMDIAKGAETSVNQYIDKVNSALTFYSAVTDPSTGIKAETLKSIQPYSATVTNLKSEWDTNKGSIKQSADWIKDSGSTRNYVSQELNALSGVLMTQISNVTESAKTTTSQLIKDSGIETISQNYNDVKNTVTTISSSTKSLLGQVAELNSWKSDTVETQFTSLQDSVRGLQIESARTLDREEQIEIDYTSAINLASGNIMTALNAVDEKVGTVNEYQSKVDALAGSAETLFTSVNTAKNTATQAKSETNLVSGTIKNIISTIDGFNSGATTAGWDSTANATDANSTVFATFLNDLKGTTQDARINIDAVKNQIDLTVQELGNGTRDFSQIKQTTNSINQLVSNGNGDISAGLVMAINNNKSSIKLSADKIELDGSVLAKSLKTNDLTINNGGSVFNANNSGFLANGAMCWTDDSFTLGACQSHPSSQYTTAIGPIRKTRSMFVQSGSTQPSNKKYEEITSLMRFCSGGCSVINAAVAVEDKTNCIFATKTITSGITEFKNSGTTPSKYAFAHKYFSDKTQNVINAYTELTNDLTFSGFTNFSNAVMSQLVNPYVASNGKEDFKYQFTIDLSEMEYIFNNMSDYHFKISLKGSGYFYFADEYGNIIHEQQGGTTSLSNNSITIQVSDIPNGSRILSCFTKYKDNNNNISNISEYSWKLYQMIDEQYYISGYKDGKLEFSSDIGQQTLNQKYALIGPIHAFYTGHYICTHTRLKGYTHIETEYSTCMIEGIYRASEIEQMFETGSTLTSFNLPDDFTYIMADDGIFRPTYSIAGENNNRDAYFLVKLQEEFGEDSVLLRSYETHFNPFTITIEPQNGDTCISWSDEHGMKIHDNRIEGLDDPIYSATLTKTEYPIMTLADSSNTGDTGNTGYTYQESNTGDTANTGYTYQESNTGGGNGSSTISQPTYTEYDVQFIKGDYLRKILALDTSSPLETLFKTYILNIFVERLWQTMKSDLIDGGIDFSLSINEYFENIGKKNITVGDIEGEVGEQVLAMIDTMFEKLGIYTTLY